MFAHNQSFPIFGNKRKTKMVDQELVKEDCHTNTRKQFNSKNNLSRKADRSLLKGAKKKCEETSNEPQYC